MNLNRIIAKCVLQDKYYYVYSLLMIGIKNE